MCEAYLNWIMKDDLLEEHDLAPFADPKVFSFKSIQATTYDKYNEHIKTLTTETPVAIGMHTNTEIGFRTDQCNELFGALSDILPKDYGSAEGGDEKKDDDDDEIQAGIGVLQIAAEMKDMIIDKVGLGEDEKNPG